MRLSHSESAGLSGAFITLFFPGPPPTSTHPNGRRDSGGINPGQAGLEVLLQFTGTGCPGRGRPFRGSSLTSLRACLQTRSLPDFLRIYWDNPAKILYLWTEKGFLTPFRRNLAPCWFAMASRQPDVFSERYWIRAHPTLPREGVSHVNAVTQGQAGPHGPGQRVCRTSD